MSTTQGVHQTARNKFETLVRNFRDAVLVSTGTEGLHGRPMLVAQVDEGPILWFVTRLGSAKVREISGDPRVLTIMKKLGTCLCVRGRAEIVQDQEVARRVWSENQRIWFTGPDDFNLALVRLEPEYAEYWDRSGVQAIKFALRATKAYVKGEPLKARDDVEQHGKVQL